MGSQLSLGPYLRDGHEPMLIRPQKYWTRYPIKIMSQRFLAGSYLSVVTSQNFVILIWSLKLTIRREYLLALSVTERIYGSRRMS
jgi:hypothetical protein